MSFVSAVFRRTTTDGVDEIHIYELGNGYCEARRPGDTARASPKLWFMELAGMLSFCGYVLQDSP